MQGAPGRAAVVVVAIGVVAAVRWLAPDATLPWCAVAAGAALLLLVADRRAPDAGAHRMGVLLAAALALASLAWLAWTGKRHELPGLGPVWVLDDDMMISLRYARNLALGDGLVWNAGERVEGITNLLWTLLLVPPHWFLATERVAAAAIVMNAALLVVALALVARIVRQLGGSSLAAGMAAVALASHHATLHWAAAGGEGTLLAVLLLWVAHVALAPQRSERAARGAALAAGLAWCTRPDAAPLLLPLLALLAWQRDPKRRFTTVATFTTLALAAAAPLAATLFRLAYYGDALPNTYWLKMTGWNGRQVAGLAYVSAVAIHHVAFAAAAPLAALQLRSRGALAIVVGLALHAGYVVYAGGDELPVERFFLPAMPFLFALAFAGAARAATATAATPTTSPLRAPWLAPLTATLLLAFGTPRGAWVPGTRDAAEASRSRAERACALIGYALRANTSPDATIAHFWAGAAPYFSQRPALDLLGKCDRTIARQVAKPGLMKPGHNKYDFAYSLAKQPDLIVGGEGGQATLDDLARRFTVPTSPDFGYRAFADLYLAPDFARFYGLVPPDLLGQCEKMPQLVGGPANPRLPAELVDTSRRFHAIFVRRGSTRAKPPQQWVAPTIEDR
jgi:arabinofuranosyltransferase